MSFSLLGDCVGWGWGGGGGEIKSQLGGRSRLYIMLCYHYRNDFSFSVGQWCMSFSLLGDCLGGGGGK